MGMGLQEIDNLLGGDATFEGWLEGFACETCHHKIWESILYFHEMLQKSKVNLGSSVSIDLKVCFNNNELV